MHNMGGSMKNVNTVNKTLVEHLVNKSRESFLLAIEIFNKPTIKYRIEGFSFFICNAWELLLKAQLIQKFGEKSIYYPESPDRSFSLEKCVKTVFTNDKDPLRINLELIIELRNTAAHFITREDEQIYIPLFQASVLNYAEKYSLFFGEKITDYIDSNFLTIALSHDKLEDHELLDRYGLDIFENFTKRRNAIHELITNNQNDKLAIGIDYRVSITKKKEESDVSIKIDPTSELTGIIIRDIKDVNTHYPYNLKRAMEEINRRLKLDGISFFVNQHSCITIVRHFELENQDKYCYHLTMDKSPRKIYSTAFVDFIVSEIKKNNKIYNDIREIIKKS